MDEQAKAVMHMQPLNWNWETLIREKKKQPTWVLPVLQSKDGIFYSESGNKSYNYTTMSMHMSGSILVYSWSSHQFLPWDNLAKIPFFLQIIRPKYIKHRN